MTFAWRKHLNTLGPLVGLVFVVVVFSLLLAWKDVVDHREFSGAQDVGLFTALGEAEFSGLKAFLGGANGKIILTQTIIVALGALGMTLIIISGGIDLSAGSVVALSSVVGARLLNTECPMVGVVLIAIAAGGLIGLVNGVVITDQFAKQEETALAHTIGIFTNLGAEARNKGRPHVLDGIHAETVDIRFPYPVLMCLDEHVYQLGAVRGFIIVEIFQ